jgi:hypothetical protein
MNMVSEGTITNILSYSTYHLLEIKCNNVFKVVDVIK